MEAISVQLFANLAGQFQQQAPQTGRDCFRKGDAAGVLQGEAVLLADALNGAHLGLLVVAQEGEKALALNGAQLGGGQRLGRDLVDAVG